MYRSSDGPDRVRVYRNRGPAILAFCGAVFFAVIGIVAAASDLRDQVVVGVFDLVFCGGLAWFFAFRYARAGVWVTKEGVRIRNPFRTVSLRWSEIDRFSAHPSGIWPKIGVARLENGAEVRIFAITGRAHDSGADNLVDALNGHLADVRARGRDTSRDRQI